MGLILSLETTFSPLLKLQEKHIELLHQTLSPRRRLKPSSSIKAKVWRVVSCLSSSFLPSGERRDQATTYPRELLELLPKLHFRNTDFPVTSETTTGADGVGGCFAMKEQRVGG